MNAASRTFVNDLGEIQPIPSERVTEIILELANLQPTDKVLEIGTGSGTQTAEFQKHCKELHSVELKPARVADYLGDHVYVHHGDGVKGLPQEAPFDAILVTCGVKELPQTWCDQLGEEGRLVVPLGDAEVQKLTLFMKRNGVVGACKIGAYCRFVMMEKGK